MRGHRTDKVAFLLAGFLAVAAFALEAEHDPEPRIVGGFPALEATTRHQVVCQHWETYREVIKHSTSVVISLVQRATSIQTHQSSGLNHAVPSLFLCRCPFGAAPATSPSSAPATSAAGVSSTAEPC
uniref:(northern house mosquito) hypothetical protein n=1 Tax=Culex pipiens TaxID=7175 RepID=A0A8D8NYV9_CULPI